MTEQASEVRKPLSDREELEAASYEVDETLLRWTLSLSLRERLRAATRSSRMLDRFEHVSPSKEG